ncbi:DgyrCDS8507 [Dimorphilus gyrociliatus]|uniref:peptidylprolyl isomerase n=1 Tax=Dimorphilus gyrociliatus TaxID=2664684 RepID=A0A7I8VVV8_9ANNE|nr:DgyrCDS8507 [Dimorphilus gyrociliatus]
MNYLTYFLSLFLINYVILQEIPPPKPGKVPLGPIERPIYDDTDENLPELEEISTSGNENCESKSDLGDEILIDYEVKLQDGIIVDSSYDRKTPLRLRLGVSNILEGWTRGMEGMCVGEKKKLKIPPHLAYGKEESELIPGNSVILVEVTLLEILEKQEERDIFREIDVNGDNEISPEEMAKFFEDKSLGGEDGPNTMVSHIFHKQDINRDGVISLGEYEGRSEKDEL